MAMTSGGTDASQESVDATSTRDPAAQTRMWRQRPRDRPVAEHRAQRCRADQIAEHYRELAAFRGIRARWGRGWRSRSSGFSDRLAAAAAELGGGLVLEPADRAWRGQRRSALGTKAPARRVFRHAASYC